MRSHHATPALRQGLRAAIASDNVLLLQKHISSLSVEDLRSDSFQYDLRDNLCFAALRKSVHAFQYLLNSGASIGSINPSTIMKYKNPGASSLRGLDMLISHGWDVDTHGPSKTDWPLLWYATATNDLEFLDWCLANGASIYFPGDTPPRDTNGVSHVPRPPILDIAAGSGSVAVYERLRALGSPASKRSLYLAVQHATYNSPDHRLISPRSKRFDECMEMVRHLVDNIGHDVNDHEIWPNKLFDTPLCFVAHYNVGKDTRELIWTLLDRGSDLHKAQGDSIGAFIEKSAVELAVEASNDIFLDAIKEWQARKLIC